MTDPIRLKPLRDMLDGITPTPWFYNGYARVASAPLTDVEDDPDTPQYPPAKRPGPPWWNEPGGEADKAWLVQRAAAYAADPDVASVPAEHGDMATGRHRNDAIFIEQAPDVIRDMINEVDELRGLLERAVNGDTGPGQAYLSKLVERALTT